MAFCICKNKDADQLRNNREADQRLCFRYTDSKIPLLAKSESSSLQPSSLAVQPGLCGTWTETPKTGFLITRLKWLPFTCMLWVLIRIASTYFLTFTVDNQNLIVQYGVLPVLHKTVCSSRRETRSAAMACLRNLSVHKANEV